MFKVLITDTQTGKEWTETVETEDELLALAESVYENHPDYYLVAAKEE